MKTMTRSPFAPGPRDNFAAPDFRIAIISDSPAHGLHALHVGQRLIELFNDDFLFHVALCPLDTFAGPESAAHRQAHRASLILLVTGTLPPLAFWHWLDDWACRWSELPRAIGAVTSGQAMEMADQLQRLCRSRDIDLITHHVHGEVEPSTALPKPEDAPHECPQLATIVSDLAATNTFQGVCLHPKT